MKKQCNSNAPCPCGSTHSYSDCCKIYHDGAPIPNALAMLRARYSAHCLMLIDFVLNTVHPHFKEDLPEASAREHTEQCMKNILWLSLEVHNSGTLPTKEVDEIAREFATYSLKYKTLGKDLSTPEKEFHTQHTSYFEYFNGTLYYTTDLDKLVNRTPARSEKLTGRNEACPCGSGKKYKKCCIHKSIEGA